MYYSNKIASLKDIFGTDDFVLENDCVMVGEKKFPIVNDVIILLEPSKWPDLVRKKMSLSKIRNTGRSSEFADDIQFTFSAEWKKYPNILSEHQDEFRLYFDLVDLKSLKNLRVCDLGCGIGRWSFFLQDKCRELVLIDFSEAIFMTRENLRQCDNAIFIMADINSLPLRDKFADFLFCLGVLHHLPVNALEATRKLKKYSSVILIYLYYSLDNRPIHFRILLSFITVIRLAVSRIRNEFFRSMFTNFVANFIYVPLVKLGHLFRIVKVSHAIPLYEGYKDKTVSRIRQDVYDRFFTRIEQRVSRKEIMALTDSFESVVISEFIPYWHFLCKNK